MIPLYIYHGIAPIAIVYTDANNEYRWYEFREGNYSDACFPDMASAKRDLVGFVEDKYNFKVR